VSPGRRRQGAVIDEALRFVENIFFILGCWILFVTTVLSDNL
jgi:hypothetical protein